MGFWDAFGDSLVSGYALKNQQEKIKREDEIYNLIKPYLQKAADDQKTTLQLNPNFRLSDIITKKNPLQDPNNYFPMGDFAPKQDTQSIVTLKQAMPTNEWMSKYGWTIAKIIGADALPWAARTGEENRLVSLIKGGLVPNGQQAGAKSPNQYGTDGNGSQYNTTASPTVNNYSAPNSQNELGKRMGFPSFDFRQQESYKPAVQPGFKNNNQAPASQGNSQVADFVGRLNNAIDQNGRESARQWIAQNRNNLIAKGIDPRIAVTLLT